jgi:hypothetical protein
LYQVAYFAKRRIIAFILFISTSGVVRDSLPPPVDPLPPWYNAFRPNTGDLDVDLFGT